ncbi:MAG TPA: hypothetical protein VGB94_08505 [Acidobacteriaceae bacterium]
MTTASIPPFSARNRREHNWIEEDFPASARIGLLHLLCDAIDRNYLSSWAVVAKELRRIARVNPQNYNLTSVDSITQARVDARNHLNQLNWERVYDFCERLYSYLAEAAVFWRDGDEVSLTRAQVQSFFAEEIQRLFDEENIGYEFRDGLVQRRGKRHTISQVTKAEKVLADQKLDFARKHFSKALRHFRDRKKPDFENAVKEAVCAVEAAAKELFPDAKAATLGEFVNWATNNKRLLLSKTIGQTFSGLYGFRSSGEGISHGATLGGAVTAELSEYVLGVAASQIILLDDLAKDIEEPPF